MTDLYYLSGPMTGYENFNREAFHEAAEFLRSLGYNIWNPAEHDPPEVERYVEDRELPEYLWEQLMDDDCKKIREDCVGIILLPGWAQSRGAKEELCEALFCGLKVLEYQGLRHSRESENN